MLRLEDLEFELRVKRATTMLIAFVENNLNEDGSLNIPEPLRPYMGGQDKIVPPTKKKSF